MELAVVRTMVPERVVLSALWRLTALGLVCPSVGRECTDGKSRPPMDQGSSLTSNRSEGGLRSAPPPWLRYNPSRPGSRRMLQIWKRRVGLGKWVSMTCACAMLLATFGLVGTQLARGTSDASAPALPAHSPVSSPLDDDRSGYSTRLLTAGPSLLEYDRTGVNTAQVTQTLADLLPAVVRISTSSRSGSGVIIDGTGLVLTGAHLVGENKVVDVIVEDSRNLVGSVLRVDAERDLALVELPAERYHVARIRRGPEVRLGDPIFAVGYPLNMPGPATITRGIVSRVLEELSSQRRVIQTDAAVNPGSSGGPLVSVDGKVVGIVTSMLGGSEGAAAGLNVAVSMDTISREFLRGLTNFNLDPP